jgi:hypothetical protein
MVRCLCDVTRSGLSAPVKEAMAMRDDGHLLRHVGREFAKNLIWMAVVFGSLGAILVAATDLPLVGTMAFVGVSVAVLASLLTVGVLWSDAPDETPLGGGPDDRPGYPPSGGGDWPGGGWYDGGGGGGGGWGG